MLYLSFHVRTTVSECHAWIAPYFIHLHMRKRKFRREDFSLTMEFTNDQSGLEWQSPDFQTIAFARICLFIMHILYMLEGKLQKKYTYSYPPTSLNRQEESEIIYSKVTVIFFFFCLHSFLYAFVVVFKNLPFFTRLAEKHWGM